MKLTVKTLKGTHFEIQVQPNNTIMAVKKNIEELQGKDNYPWGQQLLIHNGKVLKDESTLEENKVSEDGFLVVMLSKSKTSATGGSSSAQPSANAAALPPAPAPAPTPTQAAPQAQAPLTATVSERTAPEAPSDAYGLAASNLVAGSNLDQIVNQLMDMGGGNWDRDTVLRALRAAYNNPERAVDYLYSFQALRAMVQANPQILQPMLQELSKQNPQLLRTIQEHHAEFLQLINDPAEGAEGDLFDQAEQEMPHAISVTPEEQDAIARLEAMGFDRARVIEAFLACDRNEQLAANYLLEHAGDED